MGLASSQARFLSLTSRQHSVERNAQFLQAQKLRLANDSDTVYKNYMNALDATLLQTRQYNSLGKASWIDGSLNNLMRYGASSNTTGNTYYIQNISDGKLYVPKTVATNYTLATKSATDADSQLSAFLDAFNIEHSLGETNKDFIAKQLTVNEDIAQGYNYNSTTISQIEHYQLLKESVDNPASSLTYDKANTVYNLIHNSTKDGAYIYSDDSYYSTLITSLNALKSTTYYNTNTNLKTLVDFCTSDNILSQVIGKESGGGSTDYLKTKYSLNNITVD